MKAPLPTELNVKCDFVESTLAPELSTCVTVVGFSPKLGEIATDAVAEFMFAASTRVLDSTVHNPMSTPPLVTCRKVAAGLRMKGVIRGMAFARSDADDLMSAVVGSSQDTTPSKREMR